MNPSSGLCDMRKTFVVKQRSAFGKKSLWNHCKQAYSPKEKQRGAVCGDDGQIFQAVCKLRLEGIVSKKLNAPYRSGPSKVWIKVKNPKVPAAF